MADVLYFHGKGSSITTLSIDGLPHPNGYSYDFANANVLSTLSVERGELIAPSGVRYQLLVLDPRTRTVSLDELKRIRALVDAGATLAGHRPEASPSDLDDEKEFPVVADALWGGAGFTEERVVGEGRVISRIDLARALAVRGIAPEFSYTKASVDSQILFLHRRLRDGDLYVIDNRRPRAEAVDASFRVAGKKPELWRRGTGLIEPLSYCVVGDRTVVPLQLAPYEAVFVVFRKPVPRSRFAGCTHGRDLLVTLSGPWQVTFTNAGQRSKARFDELMSWTLSDDPRIKYYSGTAKYRRNLRVPRHWLTPSRRIELDLGVVNNLAEVVVNGRSLGVLWKAPFRVDITDVLQRGANTLLVRVTNTWENWLIATRRARVTPSAVATVDRYESDAQLLDSGLLGPVSISAIRMSMP